MAEIKLFDYEDEWGYQYCIGHGNLSAGVVVPQIEAAKGQELKIYIASVGGSFLDALLIYHACIEHGNVTTINQGFALSSAGLIAMAGNKRVTYSTSLFMLHKASVDLWLMGSMNSDEIKREAAGLDAADKVQIQLLTKYTGIDQTEAENMLAAETWLTGDEAKDKGFFTDLIEIGETQAMATSSYNRIVAKTHGKFAAVAKDKLKINDTMSANSEILDELKEQHKENKSFWADMKALWSGKPTAQAEPEAVPEPTPAAEPEPEPAKKTVEELEAENAELKKQLDAEKQNSTDAIEALKDAKKIAAETKTLLAEVRSNYKPVAEKKEFKPSASQGGESSNFVKPSKK